MVLNTEIDPVERWREEIRNWKKKKKLEEKETGRRKEFVSGSSFLHRCDI